MSINLRLDKFPVAKIQGLSAVASSVSTIKSKLNVGCYGLLKALRHVCGDLTTDTTFSISIQDLDEVEVYPQASIADDSVYTFTNLTWANAVPMVGEYTIVYTWTTAQSPAVDFFETMLYLV